MIYLLTLHGAATILTLPAIGTAFRLYRRTGKLDTDRGSSDPNGWETPPPRGTNQAGMRAYNERLTLSLVRAHGSLAKAELARMTGLSAQTVSVIMRALEREELLVRGEPIRGRIGQPSVPLSINPEGAFFLGLKVGRRSADLVLADFLGRPRSRLHTSYPWPLPAQIVRFAHEGIADLVSGLDAGLRERIAGLGIAMPFELWNWSEYLDVPDGELDVWRQVDLKEEIGRISPYPVYLQNDATAACAAELVFGDHPGRPDFVYFYVGTFIGGGVVLNGGLYPGRTGKAGGFGPMPVTGQGGRRELLIDHASITVLERMVKAAGGDPSILWDPSEDWSGIEDLAQAWVGVVARGLAQAIVASVSVIDFEAVVIDGSLPARFREAIVEATRRELENFDLRGLTTPAIAAGTIGPLARALGAASLPLFDKFLIDQRMPTRER